MVGIDAFPPELLLHVLQLAHERNHADVLDSEDEDVEEAAAANAADTEGLATLCSASLVAKNWRAPAQSVMWRRLRVCTPERVEQIRRSPALGRHRTARLALRGDPNVLFAREGGLVGLGSLSVWCDERSRGDDLELDWLESPGLKDLQHLELDNFFVDRAVDPSPSFRLGALTLGPSVQSPALVRAILNTSAPTLTFFHLSFPREIIHTTLLNYLSLDNGPLIHLIVGGKLPGIEAHGKNLAALFSLGFFIDEESDFENLDTLMRNLPSPVRRLDLVILPDYRRHGAAVWPSVAGLLLEYAGKPEWEGLWRVHFAFEEEVELNQLDKGPELLKLCEENESITMSTPLPQPYYAIFAVLEPGGLLAGAAFALFAPTKFFNSYLGVGWFGDKVTGGLAGSNAQLVAGGMGSCMLILGVLSTIMIPKMSKTLKDHPVLHERLLRGYLGALFVGDFVHILVTLYYTPASVRYAPFSKWTILLWGNIIGTAGPQLAR
ncbi:hypothetical protein RQP46_008279 [Phenoliferia psychrophenolica]